MTVTQLPVANDTSSSTDLSIVVYSKPACTQCDATYRYLNKFGLPYEVVDLSEDDEALEWVKDQGFQQAPVVKVSGVVNDIWSGFRPDRAKALVKALAEQSPASQLAAA